MELQRQNLALHTIQAYQNNVLKIADHDYQQSVLVTAQEVISPWLPLTGEPKIEDYGFQAFELVIIGDFAFDLSRYMELQIALSQAQIGCEVMNLGAACRTFNLLLAEGRQVLGLFRLDV
jgi:uncharacterized protein